MAVAALHVVSPPVIGTSNAERASMAPVRGYFALLSLLALTAFVLGVENRFTAAGLFVLPPPVDWVPPLTDQVWSRAFAIHQQDPAFAACGGTETIAQYKLLYRWEWLRQASLVALAGAATLGVYGAGIWERFRFVLPRLIGIAFLAAAWWPVRAMIELAVGASENLSSFNVGQYRHVVDVVFASATVAAILASTLSPPQPHTKLGRSDRGEWLWIAAILLDIGFGALFAACNATASWPTWPGYGGALLPPPGQLTSYSPWWLNLTFNPYGIQFAHRLLSNALWIAAAWQLGAALLRGRPASRVATRFGLISAQALTGIATLVLGVPAAPSIVHQVGGIILLAVALAFLLAGRASPSAPRLRLVAARAAAADQAG